MTYFTYASTIAHDMNPKNLNNSCGQKCSRSTEGAAPGKKNNFYKIILLLYADTCPTAPCAFLGVLDCKKLGKNGFVEYTCVMCQYFVGECQPPFRSPVLSVVWLSVILCCCRLSPVAHGWFALHPVSCRLLSVVLLFLSLLSYCSYYCS